MRSLIALAIVSLTPVLSVVACSSTSTPTPETDASTTHATTTADADAPSADASDSAAQCVLVRRFGSEVCENCLRAKCCTPIQACEADPACKTLHDCVSACLLKPNAPPCIDKCKQDNPAGRPKFDAFDACLAGRPEDAESGCVVACSG